MLGQQEPVKNIDETENISRRSARSSPKKAR